MFKSKIKKRFLFAMIGFAIFSNSEVFATGSLFSDDFESGNASQWTPVSGTWSVVTDGATKMYQQNDDSSERLSFAGQDSWTDYSVEALIKPLTIDTNGGVFLDFRFVDLQNRYFVKLGAENIYLNKKVDGQITTLASTGYTINTNEAYKVKVVARGTLLQVFIDGVKQLEVNDSSFAAGKIALHTYLATARFDDIKLEVVEGGSLFSDNFESGNANQWTTEGEAWSVVTDGATKMYQQNEATGEQLSYAGEDDWENYSVEALIKPLTMDTNGGAFLDFRYVDKKNRYFVKLDAGYIYLFKKVDGEIITLASIAYTINMNQEYKVKVVARGTLLQVFIDGVKQLEVNDSSFAAGKIALHTYLATARFDDIEVIYHAKKPASDLTGNWILNSDYSDEFNSDSLDTNKWINIYRDRSGAGWVDLPENAWLDDNALHLRMQYDPHYAGSTWSVVSNGTTKMYQQDDDSKERLSFAGQDGWTDYSVEALVEPTSIDSGGVYLDFRYNDGDNRYFVHLDSGNIYLRKRVNGTSEMLTSKSYPISNDQEYVVKVNVYGSDIDVYIDGNKELAVTDTSITSGKIALHTYLATARFDDVRVEDSSGSVLFSDDFESGDASDWTVANSEFVYYTSGRVDNKSGTILYGYFEARIKAAPLQKGVAPAFWFYKQEPNIWTEIDIVELTQDQTKPRKIDLNTHVWTYPEFSREIHEPNPWFAPWDPSESYHVYGLEWNEDEIKWYIDGKLIRTRKNDYWHQPLDMLFSFGLRPPLKTNPSSDGFPTTYQVDYVRVWSEN